MANSKFTLTVMCQDWVMMEPRRPPRPDGCSVHASMEALERYREDVATRTNSEGDPLSSPSGKPFLIDIPEEILLGRFNKTLKRFEEASGLTLFQFEYERLRYPTGWFPEVKNQLNPREIPIGWVFDTASPASGSRCLS